jgi:hypothetical protein
MSDQIHILLVLVSLCLAWGGCQADDSSVSEPQPDVGADTYAPDDTGSPDADTTPSDPSWRPLAVTVLEGVEEVDDALLVQLAQRYRVVGATDLTEEQHARLRELNPEIVLTKYQASVSATPALAEQYPEWLVRNAEGDPVASLNSKQLVMLDPGNTELRAARTARAVAAVEEQGFDGIMFDEAFIVASFYQGFEGINPRTGEVWEADDFRAEQLANVQAIRDALPEAVIGCNSVGRGEKYFGHLDNVRAFAGVCDALVAEGYRGSMKDPPDVFLGESKWLHNVEMGYDIAEHGATLIAACEYDQGLLDDEALKEEVDLFNYATFLLGYRDGALFSNTEEDRGEEVGGGYINTAVFHAFQTLDPGAPESDRYEQLGDAYARRFEHMLVLVNPTDEPVSVTLDANYTSHDQETFSTGDALSLEAHRAVLLLK